MDAIGYRSAGRRSRGFTIVELLIVIVVIAILASITVVAFNGVQARSQDSKIDADLAMLDKAIRAARASSGEISLRYITVSTGTAGNCIYMANGSDLSNRTTASACWNTYTTSLDRISTASGIDVRGLVDPWNRPYFIDENEQETASCLRDSIGVFLRPHQYNVWGVNKRKYIPTITC